MLIEFILKFFLNFRHFRSSFWAFQQVFPKILLFIRHFVCVPSRFVCKFEYKMKAKRFFVRKPSSGWRSSSFAPRCAPSFTFPPKIIFHRNSNNSMLQSMQFSLSAVQALANWFAIALLLKFHSSRWIPPFFRRIPWGKWGSLSVRSVESFRRTSLRCCLRVENDLELLLLRSTYWRFWVAE